MKPISYKLSLFALFAFGLLSFRTSGQILEIGLGPATQHQENSNGEGSMVFISQDLYFKDGDSYVIQNQLLDQIRTPVYIAYRHAISPKVSVGLRMSYVSWYGSVILYLRDSINPAYHRETAVPSTRINNLTFLLQGVYKPVRSVKLSAGGGPMLMASSKPGRVSTNYPEFEEAYYELQGIYREMVWTYNLGIGAKPFKIPFWLNLEYNRSIGSITNDLDFQGRTVDTSSSWSSWGISASYEINLRKRK